MNGQKVVAFGVELADASIEWPPRGSAETELCARPGWERRTIPVVDRGSPSTVEAMCRDVLGVNRMIGGEEGFAIGLACSGARISYGGRVFARCGDAMSAADALMVKASDWPLCVSGFSPEQRQALDEVMTAAELRGEILLDRVFPS